jgi:hypothetical protein
VRSTFDEVVLLTQKTNVEHYLSHNIHLIYQLAPEAEYSALMAELRGGAIFQFPFSYRGGIVANAAFLLLGADGNVFLCVGNPTDAHFIGLRATAAVVPDQESAPEEDDALDFSMV